MKTVEEEAVFLSNKNVLSNINWNDTSELERLKAKYYDGFKAGAEFAQRWISVEDELPEIGDIFLVKTDNGCITTAYLHGIKSGFITYGEDAYIEFGTITHWRPIELK